MTKFMIQSISAHPNLQTTSTMGMNSLSSGTEVITSESGQTIGSATSQAVNSQSYTNVTVTYVSGTSYTSDVNYLTNDQSISVIENLSFQKTPDLPCSISGSTSISFSTSSYMTQALPSWVTINSSTGVLSISAPDVSSDTEYDFYIASSVSGVTGSIKQKVKLTVLN